MVRFAGSATLAFDADVSKPALGFDSSAATISHTRCSSTSSRRRSSWVWPSWRRARPNGVRDRRLGPSRQLLLPRRHRLLARGIPYCRDQSVIRHKLWVQPRRCTTELCGTDVPVSGPVSTNTGRSGSVGAEVAPKLAAKEDRSQPRPADPLLAYLARQLERAEGPVVRSISRSGIYIGAGLHWKRIDCLVRFRGLSSTRPMRHRGRLGISLRVSRRQRRRWNPHRRLFPRPPPAAARPERRGRGRREHEVARLPRGTLLT
jgi:hypothetical protein